MLAVTKCHLCRNRPLTFLCDLVLSVTLLDPIFYHLQYLLPHVDVPRITGSHLGLPRVQRERGTEALSIKKKCIHRASIHPQDSRLIWVDGRKPRASDTTTVKTTAHFASEIQWCHPSWQTMNHHGAWRWLCLFYINAHLNGVNAPPRTRIKKNKWLFYLYKSVSGLFIPCCLFLEFSHRSQRRI